MISWLRTRNALLCTWYFVYYSSLLWFICLQWDAFVVFWISNVSRCFAISGAYIDTIWAICWFPSKITAHRLRNYVLFYISQFGHLPRRLEAQSKLSFLSSFCHRKKCFYCSWNLYTEVMRSKNWVSRLWTLHNAGHYAIDHVWVASNLTMAYCSQFLTDRQRKPRRLGTHQKIHFRQLNYASLSMVIRYSLRAFHSSGVMPVPLTITNLLRRVVQFCTTNWLQSIV